MEGRAPLGQRPPRQIPDAGDRQRECAVWRFVVSPVKPGGTRKEVPGPPGLPGGESGRGKQHVREVATASGISGGALRGPRDMAKAGLLEAQSPVVQERTPVGRMPETGGGSCPGMIAWLGHLPWPATPSSEGGQGDEWAAY